MIVTISTKSTKKLDCQLLAYIYRYNHYGGLSFSEGFFQNKPEKIVYLGNMRIDTKIELNDLDAHQVLSVFIRLHAAKILYEDFDFISVDNPSVFVKSLNTQR